MNKNMKKGNELWVKWMKCYELMNGANNSENGFILVGSKNNHSETNIIRRYLMIKP